MALPPWLRTWWALPAAFGLLWALVTVAYLVAGEELPVELVVGAWLPFNFYQLAAISRVVAARDAIAWSVRRAWLALLVGNVISIGGDSAWLVHLANADPSSFSPVGDTLYLLEYPAYLVGLLLVPVQVKRGGVALFFDLALVFVASAVAVWDTILRPALATLGDDAVALVFTAGPAVGDVVLVAATTAVLVRRPDPSTGAAFVLLGLSMLLYAVLDLVYAATSQAGYTPGGWLDVGWLLARLLLALAALRQLHPAGDADHVQRTATLLDRGAIFLPVAATALGFVLIIEVVSRAAVDSAAVGTGVGAAVLCLLVLVRQTWTAITNAVLARKLRAETDKSERLLLNILPASIASQLKDGRPTEPLADSVDEATVLFADLVGFTPLSASTSPQALVGLLDEVFSRFDALAERHGLEKIKTIGDAYMAAAGVPARRPDHAEAAARMALEMNVALHEVARARGVELALRIGLHTGPLVAGVIGQRKFSYDLWGDTVNTASRMESSGTAGAVHVSEATYLRLAERFSFEPRGELDIKGKGLMRTWFLLGERSAPGIAGGEVAVGTA